MNTCYAYMPVCIAGVLFCAANVSYGQAPRQPTALQPDILAARALIERGDTAEAITKIQAGLTTGTIKEPIQQQAAFRTLIIAYEQTRKPEELVGTVARCDHLVSDNIFKAIVRGSAVESLIRMGRFDEAASLGQDGLRAYAGSADAATLLVAPIQEAMVHGGQVSNAINFGRTVTKAFNGNVVVAQAASKNLADILFAAGRRDQAYEAYRVVTELVPEALNSDTNYRVQYAIYAAHNSKEEIRLSAIPILEKVMQEEPNFSKRVFVYHTLGRLYNSLGDMKRARAYMTLVVAAEQSSEAAKALAVDARGLIRTMDKQSPVEQSVLSYGKDIEKDNADTRVKAIDSHGGELSGEGDDTFSATRPATQTSGGRCASAESEALQGGTGNGSGAQAWRQLWVGVVCCAAGGLGTIVIALVAYRRSIRNRATRKAQ